MGFRTFRAGAVSRASVCALLGIVLLPPAGMRAAALPQQTSTPRLHHRSDPDDNNSSGTAPDATTQHASTLPGDVSGPYEFDHENESIEIDIDRNKLSGYISRLGDSETDSNTPLTYFFDHTSVDGKQISFQTRVVHGVWYSFQGTIVRGPGQGRQEEGYYILRGVLLVHHPQNGRDKSANETIERRVVNYKSMGR